MNTWAEYTELGFDAIPLRPKSKIPLAQNWPTAAPESQWQGAPDDSNIGLRCGGDMRLAVLDADDKNSAGTSANVSRFLCGLGLYADDLPTVATPSGGRHFYVTLAGDGWPDGNAVNLSQTFGAGEFRFGPGAQVAAPFSVLPTGGYTFVAGDLRQLPKLTALDLRGLFGGPVKVITAAAGLPVPLLWRPMPDSVRALFGYQAMARQTDGAGSSTRSGAEMKIITSLVLCGWTQDEISTAFYKFAPAHFADYRNDTAKEKYIALSYRRAVEFLAGNERRQKIARLYSATMGAPWPGRGGGLEAVTLRAYLGLAWAEGRTEFRASYRDAAMLAGAGLPGTHSAVKRLAARGLLKTGGKCIKNEQESQLRGVPETNRKETEPASEELRTRVTLHGNKIAALGAGIKDCDSCSLLIHRGAPEIFAVRGLGRSAGLVYARLGEVQQSAAVLAELTGKSRHTVYRALKILAGVGLADKSGRGWVRGAVALGEVADKLDAATKAQRRRTRFELDRRKFAELKRQRAKHGHE